MCIESENPAFEILFFILYGYLPSKYPSKKGDMIYVEKRRKYLQA